MSVREIFLPEPTAIIALCPDTAAPMLDSAMREIAPDRFMNESGLFTNDPLPVFVDQTGHNAEAAIPAIVDAFWPALARLTTESVQRTNQGVAKP